MNIDTVRIGDICEILAELRNLEAQISKEMDELERLLKEK